MMWEACAEKTKALGGRIEMGCKVVGLDYDAAGERWTASLSKIREGRRRTSRPSM